MNELINQAVDGNDSTSNGNELSYMWWIALLNLFQDNEQFIFNLHAILEQGEDAYTRLLFS